MNWLQTFVFQMESEPEVECAVLGYFQHTSLKN